MSSHDVPFRLDGDLLIASKPLDYESKSDWEVIVTASGMDNGKAVDLEATFKVLSYIIYEEYIFLNIL